MLLLLSMAFAQDANLHYTNGVEALRNKDAAAAQTHLQACVQADPNHVNCHWELGWAKWVQGDWAGVQTHWLEVKRLEPGHKEVDRHLATAQGHLQVQQLVSDSASSAPDTLRPPPPEGATVRLRAVGDVMLGTDFPKGYLPPNNGDGLIDAVVPMLTDADLTFVNLEGPLCDGGSTSKCGKGENCYAFRSPTRYGQHLVTAGVDLASTANNHASDFGDVCRQQTEDTLTALGIAYSGRPGTVATVQHGGLKIGMIGFHTSDSGHNLNDQDTAVALVKAVDQQHDLVIVSFHGGAEGSKALHVPQGKETFYGENRGELRKFTHAVVDAGADLVLGHGPHVPRAMEVYNDRLIAYSLGNFATYGRFNLSGYLGVGLVLEATLDAQGRFVDGRILPTEQVGAGIPQPDAAGRAIDLVRQLSNEDFPQTGVVVAKDGRIGAR